MGQGLSIAIAIGFPLGVSMIQNFWVIDEVKGWYRRIKKPSWNPPDWIFGPMWTVLYTAMGVASWLVWQDGGFAKQAAPLTAYGLSLLFNFLWTPLFFGLHNTGVALADISALATSIVACIVLFRPVNVTASNLMIPYLAWVGFATMLNYNIWKNNKDDSKQGGEKKEI